MHVTTATREIWQLSQLILALNTSGLAARSVGPTALAALQPQEYACTLADAHCSLTKRGKYNHRFKRPSYSKCACHTC
jgi:hypothetical protein